MEETTTSPIKLSLEREAKEKLKLFLMFVKKDPTTPIGQDIGAVIAYCVDEAVAKAMQDNPGNNVFYNGNFLVIEELLKKVQLEGMAFSVAPIEVELPQPKPMSKETFIASLKLVADDFLKGKDAEDLKKIIEKVK
jgi:hypothetical protein